MMHAACWDNDESLKFIILVSTIATTLSIVATDTRVTSEYYHAQVYPEGATAHTGFQGVPV